MRIAIDVDEVLAKLIEELLPYHNEHFGTNHTFEEHDTYDLDIVWNCTPEEAYDRVRKFAALGGYEWLKPQDGAQKATQNLAQEHTLIALTSRFDFLKDTTKKWLDRHYPGCFTEVIVTNYYGSGKKTTKGEECVARDIDVLIEDDLEHVFDAAEQGTHVLLMDAKWNQQADLPKNVRRVYDWDDVLKKIALLRNSTPE